MRYLKTYRIFEAKTSGLTQEQEKFLNQHTKGSWKYNSSTGLVDVKGDFDVSRQDLVNMNDIKFGKVSGDFDYDRNKLTSLEGAPREVGGDFSCSNNNLTSLEGAPQEVGGDFYCSSNNLTSLKGAPQEVGGNFSCEDSKLTSLKGAPQEVGGIFHCSENNLTSLEGAPQKVGGGFYCEGNTLTSLEGAPQKVGKGFDCDSFRLSGEKWNPKGWLGVLENGTPEAQSLILTLISPDVLNRKIKKDPAGMIMKLKPFWNDSNFKKIRSKLVWPKGYEEEMDIMGDINTIGF